MDFTVATNHWVKFIESEEVDKYLDLTKEVKKTVGQESDEYFNCSWYTRNSPQRAGKNLKESEIRRRIDSSLVKIG